MQEKSLVAGIFPWSKGIGFTLFQGTDSILDFRNIAISPRGRAKYLRKIQKFLTRWNPNIIALRAKTESGARKSDTVDEILVEIHRMAQDMDIHVLEYTRGQIRFTFEQGGACNRQIIAEKICDWFPILTGHLPPKRMTGDAQHHRMPLFDAIALVCTHYHLNS